MNRVVKTVFSLFFVFFCFASCISDGSENCNTYVRFVFDYNMAEADIFYKEASQVELYLFDGDGYFLDKVTDKAPDGETFPQDYRLKLPDGMRNAAQFLAWAGIEEKFDIADMTRGQTTINEFIAELSDGNDSDICEDFLPLLYGYRKTEAGPRYNGDVINISMVKNTNTIRIVLKMQDEKEPDIDIDEFSFSFTASNGAYDYMNNTPNELSWNYVPFFTANDGDTGSGVAEISTLRLYDRPQLLSIKHDPTGTYVFDRMNLTQYLYLLKQTHYSYITDLQEYFDRESHYGIIVFLSKSEQEGKVQYLSAGLSINGWYIRDQEESN